MSTIQCNHCGNTIERSKFQIERAKRSFCSPACRFEGQKVTQEQKDAKQRKRDAIYREKYKSQRRQAARKYHQENKEEINRKWREKYREERDERLKRRKEIYQSNLTENRIKNNLRQRRYAQANPDIILAQKLRYRDSDKSKITKRLYEHRKKALKYGCLIGDEHELREFYEIVMTSDSLICYYCNQFCGKNVAGYNRDATIDHKTPISRKGDHARYNVVQSCRQCNCQKANKTEAEFLVHLERIKNLETKK